MPHIDLPELPGIRALFAAYPETAGPLCELAQKLLYDDNTLSRADRELMATYVSSRNDCFYCQSAHEAIAVHHLEGNRELPAQVKADFESAPISGKLKALLAIAREVQHGGKHVHPEHVERARQQGATDREIHDTVLIAAAFCMYNRYVDGLATWAPQDGYLERAKNVAHNGYLAIPTGAAASGGGSPR